MKKGIKILMGIVIFVIVLIVTYIVLILQRVLPNPFLDTSDLYCYRDGTEYDAYKLNKYIVFSFDKWGIFVSGESQDHLVFNKEEDAKKKFDIFKDMFEESSEDILKLEDKTVILKGELDFSLDVNNMTRKQINERYSELGYECK